MTKNQKDFANMVLANENFSNANFAKSLPANLWLSNHYFNAESKKPI